MQPHDRRSGSNAGINNGDAGDQIAMIAGSAETPGDEAIAAQTGQRVAQLLAETTSALSARSENGLLLDEIHFGLAWTASFSSNPWQTFTPKSRAQ